MDFAPQIDSGASPPVARARPSAGGAQLYPLKVLSDPRGTLSFGEAGSPLPFVPVRYFTVTGVPADAVRGDHAHHECHEFLVLVVGSCVVELDDGANRVEVRLSGLHTGLHIPPMTWIKLRNFSEGAVLLVLASHPFDEGDYLRNHDDFVVAVSDRHR